MFTTNSNNSSSNSIDPAMILIVEDDNDLAELISMHLTFQGHDVVRVTCLELARQRLDSTSFDLIVLDRGLEDGDGMQLCHELRQQQNWLPVLILTARDSEKDRVEGLESGADDYLTKPFSVLEFQARVRAMLRRKNHMADSSSANSVDTDNPPEPILEFNGLTIKPESHQVEVEQQPVRLTATEFTLLHFMAQRPGRVYSKDELLEQVWHTDFSGYHHTVCSTVNRLRTKLEPPKARHKYIHTVWGVGYKFQAC